MIKIDFHIHTVANKYLDASFSYNSSFMVEYVTNNKLNAIAITNHNLFDLDNFKQIKADLSSTGCLVFPGIEISLENGHILVIGDESRDSLTALTTISNFISRVEIDNHYSMSVREFNDLVCGKGFLLIPHILKKPPIEKETIEEIDDTILCGEVKSRKHFVDMIESESQTSPVLFSDIRIGLMPDLENYDNHERFTFLDLNDISFQSIKRTIEDKNYVSLTERGGHKLFDLMGSLVTASTGINALIGKRSSGKTYLLNSIFSSEQASSLYIRQFQISKECEKSVFSISTKNEHQPLVIAYFRELLDLLDYVDSLDFSSVDKNLVSYLESLKDFAQLRLEDAYSKAKLFNYEEITSVSISEIQKLVSSIDSLLSSSPTYKNEINKYISDDDLVKLYNWFVDNYKRDVIINRLIDECNDVTKQISQLLSLKSTATPIIDIDFSIAFKKMYVAKKFNKLIYSFKSSVINTETILGEFNKTISVFRLYNKTTLKSLLGVTKNSSIDYLVDSEPFDAYLQAKEDANIKNGVANFRYRLFFDYQVRIVDKYNDDISGGQTAEYLLLNKLTHYHNFDFVLIDEMESSFDNPFLNKRIVEVLHDISKTCTVFISTHNNNLGVSLKPDYYIYHKKSKDSYGIHYQRFCGKSSDKYLIDHSSNKIKLSDILIETMEASPEAYKERNKKYEGTEN